MDFAEIKRADRIKIALWTILGRACPLKAGSQTAGVDFKKDKSRTLTYKIE